MRIILVVREGTRSPSRGVHRWVAPAGWTVQMPIRGGLALAPRLSSMPLDGAGRPGLDRDSAAASPCLPLCDGAPPRSLLIVSRRAFGGAGYRSSPTRARPGRRICSVARRVAAGPAFSSLSLLSRKLRAEWAGFARRSPPRMIETLDPRQYRLAPSRRRARGRPGSRRRRTIKAGARSRARRGHLST